jgi:glyoxylase-like metal-dependent hydrolase (beta-lactamase superfamily II)
MDRGFRSRSQAQKEETLSADPAPQSSLAEWSAVPDTNGIDVCPLINKPSLITSNAFLLRTPFEIIVIDPGASEEQKNRINQCLAELLREHPRPVLVILTHCHHDHSCQTGNIGPPGSVVKRIAHATTVEVLHRRDATLTIANLYPNAKICDARFDLSLFRPEERPSSGEHLINLGMGVRLGSTRDALATGVGRHVDRQTLRLGTGDELEFYFTPGHAPDHLSIRLGNHLFVGDLPFAANPGLAGLSGWDAGALARSIENIAWVIDSGKIDFCHTGHGKSLRAAAMCDVLKRVHSECSSLGSIEIIDGSRVAVLKTHALELLDVATDLFTVIAGRMLSTAHRLELLEEFAHAEQFRTAINVDGVEEALADLQKFCANFRADILPELSIVLKCVQVMQRVENAFVAAGEVAGAALTARAVRLLEDFFNAVRGLQITSTIETIDANVLVEAVIRNLRDRPPLGDIKLLMGEGEEAFGRSLARRLAFADILRNVEIEFAPLKASAKTVADGQRLTDVLMDAVELIGAAGAGHMVLRTLHRGDYVDIEVQTRNFSLRTAIGEKRFAAYRRILAICGSSIAAIDEQSFTLTLGPIQ